MHVIVAYVLCVAILWTLLASFFLMIQAAIGAVFGLLLTLLTAIALIWSVAILRG
jgi:hypothetical protein